MKLANLLMERRINIDLKADDKEGAVLEMLEMIRAEGVRLDYEAVIQSIREREEVDNTSYGHGFAFPHARTDAVQELYILVGISRKGLGGKTPDGIPVHVICLLLTPATIAKLYLQTLSGLAPTSAPGQTPEELAMDKIKRWTTSIVHKQREAVYDVGDAARRAAATVRDRRREAARPARPRSDRVESPSCWARCALVSPWLAP